MDESLEAENRALMQFLYSAPVGLAQLGRDGEIVLANPLCAQWLTPLSRGQSLGNLFDTLQEVAPELRHIVADFGSGTGTVCENLQIALPDRLGRRRWGRVLTLTLISLDSQRLMAVLQDITVAVRRERELRMNQLRMNSLVVGLTDYALLELDHEGCVASWNLGVHRALGYDRNACIGRSLAMFYPRGEVSPERVLDQLHEADRSGWSMDEGWRVRADGTRYWGSCLIAPVHVREDGEDEVPAEERRYSLIVRDISERRDASEALRQAMTCDDLTGLENRRSFFEAADLELARWQRAPRPLSLLLVTPDGFGLINDAHGQFVGDGVLRHLAACLSATFRGMDVTARLGGLEFAVLLPGTAPEDAAHVAARLCENVRSSAAQIGELAIACTVSVGVASMEAGIAGAQGLVQRADLAMHTAKTASGNRVQRWHAGLTRAAAAVPGPAATLTGVAARCA